MKKITACLAIALFVCLNCVPAVRAEETEPAYKISACFTYRFATVGVFLRCAPGMDYMFPYSAEKFWLFAVALEKTGFKTAPAEKLDKTDITIIMDEVSFNDWQQLEIPVFVFNKSAETKIHFKLLDNHGLENMQYLAELIKKVYYWEDNKI